MRLVKPSKKQDLELLEKSNYTRYVHGEDGRLYKWDNIEVLYVKGERYSPLPSKEQDLLTSNLEESVVKAVKETSSGKKQVATFPFKEIDSFEYNPSLWERLETRLRKLLQG